MRGTLRRVVWGLSVVVLCVGCASPPTGASGAGSKDEGGSSQKAKRIVVAMMGQPSAFVARMNLTSNTVPGVSDLEQLVNASLSEQTRDHNLQPQLAEAVPSVQNDLWTVFPDG